MIKTHLIINAPMLQYYSNSIYINLCYFFCTYSRVLLQANKESSEVREIVTKPGRRVKLNRSQALNIHKLLTIRYVPAVRPTKLPTMPTSEAFAALLSSTPLAI